MPIRYGSESVAKARANKAKQKELPATEKQKSLTAEQPQAVAHRLITENGLTAPATEATATPTTPALSNAQQSLDLVSRIIAEAKKAKENK